MRGILQVSPLLKLHSEFGLGCPETPIMVVTKKSDAPLMMLLKATGQPRF
jgi:hypothetical protein